MSEMFDHGSGTAMHRRQRFSRKSLSSVRLTDDDNLILRYVGRFRFLRSTHIQRLLPDRAPKKIIERLCALYHTGYLDRPKAQINYFASSGSAPLIHALGDKSAEQFAERELSQFSTGDWTDKNRSVKRPYIEHALLLADLMIPIECRLRARSDIEYIESEFLRRELLGHRINGWTLTADIRSRGAHHLIPAVPDCVFALHFKNENRRSFFFVEADRATMPITRSDLSQSSFRRRLLAYLSAHKARQHIDRFGFHNLRILTITTSADRVHSMIAAVNDITDGKGSGIFLFADVKSFAKYSDPLTQPWITTNGPVRIDTPPRFHAGPM